MKIVQNLAMWKIGKKLSMKKPEKVYIFTVILPFSNCSPNSFKRGESTNMPFWAKLATTAWFSGLFSKKFLIAKMHVCIMTGKKKLK